MTTVANQVKRHFGPISSSNALRGSAPVLFEVLNLRPVRKFAQQYGSIALALPAVSKAAMVIAGAYVSSLGKVLGPGLPSHWANKTTDYVAIFIEKNWTPEHVLRVYYTLQAQMSVFGKYLWLPK